LSCICQPSGFYGSLPNAVSPGPIPEPATLTLLPVGAALWACRRRRSKNNRRTSVAWFVAQNAP